MQAETIIKGAEGVDAEIKAKIDAWNNGLDNGDIKAMLATCHDRVITVNERQPVTIGKTAIRNKYQPRIDQAEITSGFDIETLETYDDTIAIVVGRFYGTMKDRQTGEIRKPEGRLSLIYKRNAQRDWEMILDIDNNGPA